LKITGIVGLDLSITGSGVVKYLPQDSCLVYLGTIGTSSKFGSMVRRWDYSIKKILQLITKDDLVFIEDYAFNVTPNKSSIVTLAEMGGIIKYLIWRKTGRTPICVASTTLKKWLSGSGKLSQDDFKMAGYKKYKIEFGTKDEVIAYTLTDFGRNLVALPRNNLLEYEKKMLKDFELKHPLLGVL
jgi:Holliday junction resolvasome RuvABC endonuclease subunit